MSHVSARPAVESTARPSGLAPLLPVMLPAAPDRLAPQAVRLLDWDGVLLPPMKLLGRKVVVLAELLADAHAERLALGCPPVTDRTTVATWVWPELTDRVPPPAVRLRGVLAPARHWRTALVAAVPFGRFCDVGIVIPEAVTATDDYLQNCLPRAVEYGVEVLTADEQGQVSVAQHAEPARESDAIEPAVFRWINELIYQQLLEVTGDEVPVEPDRAR